MRRHDGREMLASEQSCWSGDDGMNGGRIFVPRVVVRYAGKSQQERVQVRLRTSQRTTLNRKSISRDLEAMSERSAAGPAER